MNEKKTIALILITDFILRVIFIFAVPVFEKPDEKSHFEYIKFIAENNRLPVQQKGQTSAEYFQPPFYQIMASFVLKLVNIFTDETLYQIISLRFLSSIISIITLYFIYKLSKLILKNKKLVIMSVAFAAFLPSLINTNTGITNSNFSDLLAVLIIYQLALMLKEEKGNKHYILGILSGTAMITRLNLIPVVCAIPVAYLIKYYKTPSKLIKPLLIIGAIALTISGWNFLRNFNLYGDFLGINAMKLASPPDQINVNLIFIGRLIGWTFITFWASFGRTNGIFIGNLDSTTGIIIFIFSYSVLLILSLLSVYGLYRLFMTKKIQKQFFNEGSEKLLLVMLAHLFILAISFLSFNLYDFQPQGRLFFSALAIISIVFNIGTYEFFHKRIKNFEIVYFSFFALVNIASIASILAYY